jgi:ABC-type transport system involved in multi-copper enzyme maturation permease subunit
MALLSFLYGAYIIARALFGRFSIEGWASLIVSIYFVGGMIMVVLGIIGVYVGKMYNETKRRPLYVIADRVGLDARPQGVAAGNVTPVRARQVVS